MTEEGSALVFPNRLTPSPAKTRNESLNGVNHDNNAESYKLDMKDLRYQKDFSPISKDCSCYTCRKHTRAYVNHLLLTNELLGPILLMIHNLTHYQGFFASVRECVQKDLGFESLRAPISRAMEASQEVKANGTS